MRMLPRNFIPSRSPLPACARATILDELGPGESAVMYFDVTFTDFKSVPHEIAHRVSASKAVVIDETPGPPTEEPPIVEEPASTQIVAIGGAVKVKVDRAITLSPPLQGDGWIDGNGCCAILERIGLRLSQAREVCTRRSGSRSTICKLTRRGERGWERKPTERLEGFGAQVRSAGRGQVVSAVDGYDDNIPSEDSANNHARQYSGQSYNH